jgi:hypothetical protein
MALAGLSLPLNIHDAESVDLDGFDRAVPRVSSPIPFWWPAGYPEALPCNRAVTKSNAVDERHLARVVHPELADPASHSRADKGTTTASAGMNTTALRCHHSTTVDGRIAFRYPPVRRREQVSLLTHTHYFLSDVSPKRCLGRFSR